MPSLENTLTLSKEKSLTNSKEQKNFLETTLGKVINTGLNLGLRVVLPDFIENEVIGIKDTILKEGFGAGIKKCINSAVDLGKSAIGIFTGKFENVSQVQTAIKNGGLIDSLSELLTTAINKAVDAMLDAFRKSLKQAVLCHIFHFLICFPYFRCIILNWCGHITCYNLCTVMKYCKKCYTLGINIVPKILI